ncbi:MAG: hypothetical protein AAGE94_12740 [Acidobacteriota bacterium]
MLTKRIRALVLACIVVVVVGSASADDSVECLNDIALGCYNGQSLDDLWSAESKQQSLMADALADGSALSDAAWSRLVGLVITQPDRHAAMREQYRDLHWQDLELDGVTEAPRVWARRWRDHRPKSRAAWCEWAEHVDTDTALTALRRTLDADPSNDGARQCLVRRLAARGAIEEVRDVLADHPLVGDEIWPRSLSLPGDLEPLFILYGEIGDLDAQTEIVRQAVARRPGDAVLEAFVVLFGGGDDEEDQTRIARLVAEDLPIELLAHVCDRLIEDEACVDRLVETVLARDLHRDPKAPLDKYTLLMIRSDLLDRAIREEDPALVEQVLFEGPDVGRFHLWSMAVDGTLDWNDEDDDARLTHEALCERIHAEVLDGDLDATVLDVASVCPVRIQRVGYALESCRSESDDTGSDAPVDDVQRHLLERLANRFPTWPTETLLDWDEPRDLVIAELERRLESTSPARLLDHLAVLNEDAEADPARALALRERLLAIDSTEGARCRWLDAFVLAHAGPRIEALERALVRWPKWHDLRLHLMVEGVEPARAQDLARQVLVDPESTVRQRAEAHQHLGRLARRAGRSAEALDHQERYFLARLEAVGCPEYRPECDEPMLRRLAASQDRERILRYLGARRALIGPSAERLGAPAGVQRLQERLDRGCGLDRPWSDALCSEPIPIDAVSDIETMAFCH